MEFERVEIPAAPPSVNRIWRKGRRGLYLAAEARDFYSAAAFAVGSRRVPSEWLFYDVTIIVYKRLRGGDVDNRIKTTLDALTKSGYWEDDAKVARVSICFGGSDAKGRTVVEIRAALSKFPFKGVE